MGLCLSASSTLQYILVGFFSHFCDMFDRDMVLTQYALSVSTTASVAELNENFYQVSRASADSSLNSLLSAHVSGLY